MKKIALLFIAFTLAYAGSSARPEWSILQGFGAKCSGCHVNAQGGGVRNNAGWMSRKDISLINPETIGLGGFYDAIRNSNTFVNDMVTFGLDYRYQNARWPKPPDAKGTRGMTQREGMNMQIDPYLVVQPLPWLYAEGFYNLAYNIDESKKYIGQNSYAASLNFKPADNLPTLRVGFFQPTIGTKYDDHTILIRTLGSHNTPLIPDDYAEWGAQIDYEGLNIGKILGFGFSAGVFDSKNLTKLTTSTRDNKTIPIVDTNSMSAVFKAIVYPELGKGINSFLGGYWLTNGNFNIQDAFFNIGLADKVALMTEVMLSQKKEARYTQAIFSELSVQPYEWFVPYIRAERSWTYNYNENKSGSVYPRIANQFVIGAHFFPLPFIEILPEYRAIDHEEYHGYFSEWAVQLHIFY